MSVFRKLYDLFGISSLYDTGWDAWLVIIARSSRMLAYGATSIIIALLFSALDFSDTQIGLFMTLTLAGDVFLTLLLTMAADKLGRRRVLLLGALMMIVSGATFIIADQFWILLLAAVIGVISATGGDFGPFRAIEESIIAQLTNPSTRNDVLTWYVTMSSVGSAIGTVASGNLVELLRAIPGWSITQAYHAAFAAYLIMGSLNLGCFLMMSKRSEIETKAVRDDGDGHVMLLSQTGGEVAEDYEILEVESPTQPSRTSEKSVMKFTQLSPATRRVMFKLWPLLIVDSLADGMVGYSLTAYYMERRFQLATSTLGNIASISYFLSAASNLFSAPLANRFGPVNTMVFTHLPSSTAVLFFPLAPNLTAAIILFFIRTGLNNMDQAPRSAFISASVPPSERTTVMGITSVLRTLASTAGPTVTGLLAESDHFWIAFVAAGSLRIAYDFGLWALFVNMKVDVDAPEDVE